MAGDLSSPGDGSPHAPSSHGKKFILVNPPSSEEAYHSFIDFAAVFPPIGLISIGAVLEDLGCDVSVLDADARRLGLSPAVDEVVEAAPDFVGLTTMTAVMGIVGRFLAEVKGRLPNVKIIVGGPHASALPAETLEEYQFIDIAIVGEGDETVRELLPLLEKGDDLSPVRGIAFRKDGEVVVTEERPLIEDLGSLPMPAWHLLDSGLYRSYAWNNWVSGARKPLGVVFTGRGCYGKCNFCASHCVFGRRIRYFPVERIKAEIDHLVRTYGIKVLYFQDDTFTANRRIVNEICDFLIERGYSDRMETMVSARVDAVHAPTLKHMREAGIRWICFGVESGNDEILKRMGKNISVQQIRDAYRTAREAGLFIAGNFMLGHIGETRETALASIDVACRLDQDYVSFAIAIPFPGTELYQYCIDNAIKLPSWDSFGSVNSPPIPLNPGLGAEELMELRALSVTRFFARPGYVLKMLVRFKPLAVIRDFAKMYLAMKREQKAKRF